MSVIINIINSTAFTFVTVKVLNLYIYQTLNKESGKDINSPVDTQRGDTQREHGRWAEHEELHLIYGQQEVLDGLGLSEHLHLLDDVRPLLQQNCFVQVARFCTNGKTSLLI